jgi:anti-sigma factor RsiW
MTHLDEDTLLKFVLETLDAPDASLVREHLAECQLCTQQEKKFRMEVGRLIDVEVQVEAVAPPRLPRRMRILAVATRAAAILAVGFLAGYLTAELSHPIRPETVQQRLVPGRLTTPPSGYIPCQAVDVTAGR